MEPGIATLGKIYRKRFSFLKAAIFVEIDLKYHQQIQVYCLWHLVLKLHLVVTSSFKSISFLKIVQDAH